MRWSQTKRGQVNLLSFLLLFVLGEESSGFSLRAGALFPSDNGEALGELKAVQTPVIRFCSCATFSQYG